ncbi:MAG TPA: MBL fold metallo-hydrolase [Chloroflexia bacterium]|nr:MBL fold metallo-hydrolase [Chloroflexia bacterium]
MTDADVAPGPGTWRPDDPLPSIQQISLPTPFKVGPVNSYVVATEPLTLVDCGPLTDEAWVALERGLADLGRRVQDIGRLIITHGHVDHWGLAARIVARSGAEVWAHRRLATWMSDFPGEWQRRTAFLTLLCTQMGVPAGEMVAMNRGVKGVGRFAEAVAPTRLLDAGDEIALAGYEWTVHYTPGHATGHIALHQSETRCLIAGDHLLADISSNPVLEAPLLGETERPRMLPLYLQSLAATAQLPVLWVYPGHGRPFQGHRKLISRRLQGHEARAAQVKALLAVEPADCYTLSRRLFPRLEGVDLFLGFSETLGHLDLLEDRGEVRLDSSRRPALYRNVL